MTKRTKKNWALRVMLLAFIFTLISTCLMSGTLAKYVSTASGSDTARVAKWGFDGINTVDIFDDSYGTTVESSGTDNVIAPGTTKQFSFGFASGISEVSSKITFTMSETNVGLIPIVYMYGSSYYSNVLTGTVYLKLPGTTTYVQVTIAGNVAAMGTAIGGNTGYANVAPNTNYNTLTGGTITWYWAFEQANDTAGTGLSTHDTTDTTLGTAGTATVTLNISLKAEQID